MMLNTVILVGYAGKQPELRYFKSGKILCKFPIVVQSSSNTTETLLEYIDLELWNKTAKVAAQYVPKGREIGIIGSLKFSNWEDRRTGKSRQSPIILVNQIHLLGTVTEASKCLSKKFNTKNYEEDHEDFYYQEDIYEDSYQPYNRYDNSTDYGYLNDLDNIYEYLS
jgi:single-strand DNA-binding protein